jgi:hypothetical protein
VIRYTIQQVVDLCYENTKSDLFKVANKIQIEESTKTLENYTIVLPLVYGYNNCINLQ